jgi:uncharacterized protein YciI
MYILLLKYIKPIEEVEKALNSHVVYLEKYYSLKKFICSGRQNPRTGGVILCTAQSINEVNEIIREDPFFAQKIAQYEIIEFSPTKYDERFKCFITE